MMEESFFIDTWDNQQEWIEIMATREIHTDK